ncbi:hypothetical protein [Undibacterium sp.]|uniref:hypothetical protein n=1 Tax=Undibacterium sp. TaxID=1914977 RepID=UPI0037503BB4
MPDKQLQEDECKWFSIGRLSHWVWCKILTPKGFTVFSIISTMIGVYFYSRSDKQFMLLFAPLAIIIIGFFLFITGIVAVFGDAFAGWAMEQLFNKPDPNNTLHQILYFIFSSAGFVFAAFILDIGDPHIRSQ